MLRKAMTQNYFCLLVFLILGAQTAAAADTGFLSPTANQADRGGHNDGYETNPGNAYKLDGLFAVDNDSGTSTNAICSNTGKDRHRFYDYNIPVSAGSRITGIEVRLDAKADSAENSPAICVQLSWDGGTSWTASRIAGPLGASVQTFILGNPADIWGDHVWVPNDLINANFRVRLADIATDNSRDFFLDWVAVRISYIGDEKKKPEDSRRSAR
jgi:hypothetical protein